MVLLPLWLQTQLDYTATWAGIPTAPVGVLPLLLTPLLVRSMSRIDLRWITTASFGEYPAASSWFAGFNTQVSSAMLGWPRFAQGVASRSSSCR
jgi:DHA2 family multidrug resistance protein